jgi:hypothetical protein
LVALQGSGDGVKTLAWYRIELDSAGKVASCREVAEAGTDSRVYFFRAQSAKQAASQALNAHAAKLLAARRARYGAEGLCRCGGKRDRPGFKSCARCDSRDRVHEERKRARDRGEVVPPLDRRTVLLERKTDEASQLRLAVLREVQDAWIQNRTVGAFSAWLVREVEKLAGKRVA